MTSDAWLAQLLGGDLRSIGRSNEVVEQVLSHPELFDRLIDGMASDNPLIRMRAADAAEKVTTHRPDLLQPHRARLLCEIAAIEQQEVRWHVALMLPRMPLPSTELASAVTLLRGYLADDSRIVRVNAMQALADLACQHSRLRSDIRALLVHQTDTGTPAMRARGRKLLAKLDKVEGVRP
jgi:HEAT repeat protein